MTACTRIVLARRPKGDPGPQDFRLETADLPAPAPGEMLLRTIWLSLDPYMRGRMNEGPSYSAPVELGHVMTGQVVAEVMDSNRDGFAPGDLVLAMSGWTSHAISDGKEVRRIDPALAPVSTALGVLGLSLIHI